jgi:hypothetical protein
MALAGLTAEFASRLGLPLSTILREARRTPVQTLPDR